MAQFLRTYVHVNLARRLSLAQLHHSGAISIQDLEVIREEFGAALSPETIQGWALSNSHMGYAGDFKIIEKIYNNFDRSSELSSREIGIDYFHSQKAATSRAKSIVIFSGPIMENVKRTILQSQSSNFECRFVGPDAICMNALEVLWGKPDLRIDCVEQDMQRHSISLTQACVRNLPPQYQLYPTRIFSEFFTNTTYHLIWSAGIIRLL